MKKLLFANGRIPLAAAGLVPTVAFTLTVTAVIFLTACQKPTNGCFTYSPTTIPLNAAVTFDAACSQNASTFIWNFGDNTGDTTVHSLTVMHKFSTAGQFSVSLNAERKDGMTLGKSHPTTTQVITVQ